MAIAYFATSLTFFDAERAAVTSSAGDHPIVTSDHGDWYPDVPSEVPAMPMKEQLIRNLSNRFPQFSRDQIEEMLRKATPALKKEMPQIVPLAGAYESNIIERFVSGTDVRYELIRGAAKPRVLIGHYLESIASARNFFSSLAEFERTLSERLKQSREDIGKHVKRLVEAGRDIEEIKQWAKTRRADFSTAAYLGLDSLSTKLRDGIAEGKYLAEIPAISTHCSVMTAYMRDILMPSLVMPAIKESDAADIMHATYLPYVDLYRTDGRFSSLLEKVPKSRRVQVVAKLRQLPAAVDRWLAGSDTRS